MSRFVLALILSFACSLFAQAPTPAKKQVVQWTLEFEPPQAAPGQKTRAKLTAKIDEGWHMYSLTTPKGGGLPTQLKLAENPALSNVRFFQPKPESKFDPNFQVNTERYDNQVIFYAEADVAQNASAGSSEVTAQIRYSACTDKEQVPRHPPPRPLRLPPTRASQPSS
jgi:DsbC/DsbD-like thiol-disulfide interchange protein